MDWVIENIDWISTLIGGLLGGSAIGYRIGINKSVKQKIKSGKNSKNTQIGGDYNAK
ncbi:MAG: hypothetical protein SNJ29_12080 [Rikenellaceae bacterium]